jgi:hypothetical protein
VTYWYTAYCHRCKSESPPLFVTSFSKVSLYPLDEGRVRAAGEWIEEHGWHEPVILHEDHELHVDARTP